MPAQKADTTESTVVTAVFTALIAALGLVPAIAIGVLPVPLTVQTLGVMLAGALLGPLRGGLASTVVVVLATAGMPILAGGRGGMGVLLGPTGGYLIGWIPAAIVVGFLVKYWAIRVEHTGLRHLAVGTAVFIGGVLVIYLFGVPWTSAVTGLSLTASAVGSLAFLPGDLAKVVVVTLTAVNVHRSYRRLLGT